MLLSQSTMDRDAAVKFTSGIAGHMLQSSLITLDSYFRDIKDILRKDSLRSPPHKKLKSKQS